MKHRFFLLFVPAVMLASCCGGQQAQDGQRLFVGDDIAVTQTQYGKVQGYILDGVYTYLGIPYGASTAGENRFMPPQEPTSWEGVRPALFYGNDAPQGPENKWKNNSSTFTDHWNYYDYSEDCLNLNVWTPAPDGKKRPVLVWMHGGGFAAGNSIEQDGYHGANLSRSGDIVFVSVNHRLNVFGFSDLSAAGPEFAHSGNVGVLDLVAASFGVGCAQTFLAGKSMRANKPHTMVLVILFILQSLIYLPKGILSALLHNKPSLFLDFFPSPAGNSLSTGVFRFFFVHLQ